MKVKLIVMMICLVAYINTNAQDVIETGMKGSEIKSAINNNFNDIYDYKSPINVMDYGAKGDGVTDDSASIYNALIAANGRKVFFPSGVYLIKGAINITTDTTVIIEGENAVIRTSGLPHNASVLGVYGNVGSKITVTDDVKIGEYYIRVTDATPYNYGDVLYIYDDRSLGGSYKTGEALIVHSNNGDDSIRLMTPVMFPYYTSESVGFRKMSKNPVIISGITIEGEKIDKLTGIYTYYRSNIKIYNNKVSGCIYAGIAIDHGINATVNNNTVYDSWYGNETIAEYPGGDNYGISIASFKAVDVYENDIYEARHCIETGGYQPCCDINIHHNRVYSTIGSTGVIASISTHYVDSYITVSDNIIYGDGITLHGQSLRILNNKIYVTEPSNSGIKIISLRDNNIKDNNWIIKNNEINSTSSVVGNYGIYLLLYGNDTINNCIIADNVIKGMNCDMFVYSDTSCASIIKNMCVENNIFGSNDLSLRYIQLTDSMLIIENLKFANNYINKGVKFVGDTIHHLKLFNNYFDINDVSDPITISDVGLFILSNNEIDCNDQDFHVDIEKCNTAIITTNNIVNSSATNPIILDQIVNLLYESNVLLNTNAILKSNITNDSTGTNYEF